MKERLHELIDAMTEAEAIYAITFLSKCFFVKGGARRA